MLCQRCKKNPATVHLTEIIEGDKSERHLCKSCADDEQVTMKDQVPINELLTKFVMAHAGASELADKACPHCGITFMQFRNAGVLGCPHDYDVFDSPLIDLLERAHEGHSRHVGKVPGQSSMQSMSNTLSDEQRERRQQLQELRRQLDEAVQAEHYEEAARLRDQIHTLEQADNE